LTPCPRVSQFRNAVMNQCNKDQAIPTPRAPREQRHCICTNIRSSCLTTETVQGAALALESVDDVEGGDGLALGVLGVGDGVTDDTLEEGLENTAGLLVDH